VKVSTGEFSEHPGSDPGTQVKPWVKPTSGG
jgi:hypothetical protein